MSFPTTNVYGKILLTLLKHLKNRCKILVGREDSIELRALLNYDTSTHTFCQQCSWSFEAFFIFMHHRSLSCWSSSLLNFQKRQRVGQPFGKITLISKCVFSFVTLVKDMAHFCPRQLPMQYLGSFPMPCAIHTCPSLHTSCNS